MEGYILGGKKMVINVSYDQEFWETTGKVGEFPKIDGIYKRNEKGKPLVKHLNDFKDLNGEEIIKQILELRRQGFNRIEDILIQVSKPAYEYFFKEYFWVEEKIDGANGRIILSPNLVGWHGRTARAKFTDSVDQFMDWVLEQFTKRLTLDKTIIVYGEICHPKVSPMCKQLSKPYFVVFDIYDVEWGIWYDHQMVWDIVKHLQTNEQIKMVHGFKGNLGMVIQAFRHGYQYLTFLPESVPEKFFEGFVLKTEKMFYDYKKQKLRRLVVKIKKKDLVEVLK